MNILQRVKIILLAICLALLIAQMSLSAPTRPYNKNPNVLDEPVNKPDDTNDKVCPNGVCRNKGRFCELICKNNPSEGGKMCK